MTDGGVAEKNKTRNQVIRASRLPLSIIIVGIGKSSDDFEFMKSLDGDDAPVRGRDSKNQVQFSSRDCVQFVSYQQMENDP